MLPLGFRIAGREQQIEQIGMLPTARRGGLDDAANVAAQKIARPRRRGGGAG